MDGAGPMKDYIIDWLGAFVFTAIVIVFMVM